MTDNTMTIEVATENYASALARLRELDGAVFDSQRAVAAAEREATAILDRAAAGSTVSGAGLLAARDAAAAAKRDLEVARAVQQAGQVAVDQAEVALIHAKAATARADLAALRARAADDARLIDAAIAAAREALAALVATGRALDDLRTRVRGEMDMLRAAAARNSVLKGQHSSVHPKFPALDAIGFHRLDGLSIDLTRPASMPQPGTEDTRLHRGAVAWLGFGR